MKKIIFITILLFPISFLFCQTTDFYWYKNQKIHLGSISNKKFIIVSENINNGFELKQTLNIPDVEVLTFRETSSLPTINSYNQNEIMSKKSAIIKFDNLSNVNVVQNLNVLYESPFYYSENGLEIGISHLFYVKLFDEDDLLILEELANEHNVKILGNNKFMPLWFTLSCSKYSNGNALDMANYFYETDLFSATVPNFMFGNLFNCVNDNYFDDQWGLKNTGQEDGIVDVDINACNAWEITKGNEDIIVAVIDQGIEINHPDLPNIYPFSYDTETGGSGEIYGVHGTWCAGIIGASKNNEIGIAGIAPDCPLMSISHSLIAYDNFQQDIADGFFEAWTNGASVISNSWAIHSECPYIADAINEALTQGRGGLGCVVVFSSGNSGCSTTYYPDNPGILTVGGIDRCGVRSGRLDYVPNSCDPWGIYAQQASVYGDGLDVVAPGTSVPTTCRVPPNGNYYHLNMWGTSAAAPHVAGVAALILSVNPNLTVQEVNYIIKSTAQKIGDYEYEQTEGRPYGDWHEEVGYGLVDAYAALLKICVQEFYVEWDIEENETVHFKASEKIIANNIIESGADATYQAGNRIVLQDGFHAKQGSKFHAYIAPCEIGGGGTKMLITDNNAPPHIGRTNNNIKEREDEIPADIEQTDYKYIFSAYPNPFDNSTIITFSVSEPSYINIYITNTDGQHVHQLHNKHTEAGNYELKLDGTALQPGVYFCVMETKADREVIKLVKM